MTKERLKKINDIKKQIEIIKKELCNLDREGICCDRVTGSSHNFPYIKRHYTIEGYSQRYYKKQAILYKKLSVLNEELINERLEIEDWLEGVKDNTLNLILRLKYINGMTWEQIGKELGYSSRAVRFKHSRFWRSMQTNT